MAKSMNALGKHDLSMAYETKNGSGKGIIVRDDAAVIGSNLLFPIKDAKWYTKMNRYGWIDPFDHDRVTREYLFFTKPDLNLFVSTDTPSVSNLNPDLLVCPEIVEVATRQPYTLGQLQSSVKDQDGVYNPFMFLLSNAVSSKLDLPTKSADSQEITSNIMGTTMHIRGHSYKSNNGYDFSLSFTDTAYLDIYNLVNAYDAYFQMIKQGFASPKHDYIINNIISDQFSIYKFLVGSDGETILYYAMLTGCFFTDVPRSEFGDPNDGSPFKYAISFHAQFVDDSKPYILQQFNRVALNRNSTYLPVYNPSTMMVDNQWAKYPRIIKASINDPVYGKRVARRGVTYDYFLKWMN